MLNKKGFTFVELLSVIVIVGIIGVIIIPVALHSYDVSKNSSEKSFKQRITQLVDTYIVFNIENTLFEGENYESNKYLNTITLKDAIYYNDIYSIVNPKNNMECNIETLIDIYKDENNNYCFKIEDLDCLTEDKYINTCI